MRASGVAVTIVVHEHKRLGRDIELAALAGQLRAAGIGLEFLTGELAGSHDRPGLCSPCWPRCREWSASTSATAPWRARVGPRPRQGDRRRRRHRQGHARRRTAPARAGMSLREIAARLVIATGKKKGQHPSSATVLRMLRDHDERAAAAAGG
jgi:hypothetical protein